MGIYATLNDMTALFRPLTPEESTRADNLIDVVEFSLRVEADKVGKDLDKLAEDCKYAYVIKSVVVDVVARALMTSTTTEPMTQMSQSALGYSVSGTFLNPGGGIFIKRSELSRLGLRRQRLGVIELC